MKINLLQANNLVAYWMESAKMNSTGDYQRVSAAMGDRLPFWTSCPYTDGWVIDFLSNHSDTVPWKEFKSKTHWEEVVSNLGYRIPSKPKINSGGLWLHKDWTVGFHKVDPVTVDGHLIYYFVWSAIEYIFCTEVGREVLLQNAKAEWEREESLC